MTKRSKRTRRPVPVASSSDSIAEIEDATAAHVEACELCRQSSALRLSVCPVAFRLHARRSALAHAMELRG
jgi:hypothetical protein